MKMKFVLAGRIPPARIVRANAISSNKVSDGKVSIQKLRSISDLPAEDGLPFVGHGLNLLKPGFDMRTLFDKHGQDCNAIRIKMGMDEYVAVRTTEDMQRVFKGSDFEVKWTDAAGKILPRLGKSPEDLQELKKAIKQILAPDHIARIQLPLTVKTFSAQIRRHTKNGEPVKWVDACKRMTNSVISASVIGDIFTKADYDYMFPRYVALGKGTFAPNFNLEKGLPFTPYSRGYVASQELSEYLVAKLQPLLEPGADVPSDSLLQNLIKYLEAIGLDLTDTRGAAEVLAAEVMHLTWAGSDTTALTMARCTQLLAAHPEWLQALWEEQQRLMAEFGPDLDRRVVSRSAVALAVVQETLRLRPASTFATRDALQDTSVAGIAISKGSKVLLHLRQATKETGPGTDDFSPDYWLSEDRTSVTINNSPGNVAFGGGRRMCPGINLALTEATVFVALLARSTSAIHMSPSDMHADLPISGSLPTDLLTSFVPRS